MVTLHVKGQTVDRKRSAQGYKVYFELSEGYVLQGSGLLKPSLLPLEYRKEMKDLVLSNLQC